jgi:nitrile hydratase accessory protein
MNHVLPEVARLPLDNDGPVFSAPWEAEAFALGVSLHQRQVYTWPEFAEALTANIATDPAGAIPYYEHWLTAVETLVVRKGVATEPELDDRIEAWHAAAERTPHGKPILLFGNRER